MMSDAVSRIRERLGENLFGSYQIIAGVVTSQAPSYLVCLKATGNMLEAAVWHCINLAGRITLASAAGVFLLGLDYYRKHQIGTYKANDSLMAIPASIFLSPEIAGYVLGHGFAVAAITAGKTAVDGARRLAGGSAKTEGASDITLEDAE
ncbi:MAG: hypothetical protein V1659_04345 [Candidatus Woesearchaeota archaeon]